MAIRNLIHNKETKSHQSAHPLSRLFRDPEQKDSNTDMKELNIIVSMLDLN